MSWIELMNEPDSYRSELTNEPLEPYRFDYRRALAQEVREVGRRHEQHVREMEEIGRRHFDEMQAIAEATRVAKAVRDSMAIHRARANHRSTLDRSTPECGCRWRRYRRPYGGWAYLPTCSPDGHERRGRR
jgi:hypothetical protein